MTDEELKIIQSYPLDIKIEKTKLRIREWVKYWGIDNTYISFSGGKDSTVLLDIARQEYPDIKAIFCDTGLEYPEVKEFVKKFDNVEIIRPKKTFKDVIIKYGYPIISKEQSHYIYEIRNTKSEKIRDRRLNGDEKGRFKLSKRWRYLLNAPFLISDMCCYHLKKSPMISYDHRTNSVPILATMTEESLLRKTAYLKNGGCNAYHVKYPKSQPMAFWNHEDIYQYIVENDLDIAECYGEISESNGRYHMDGIKRTGCIFCGYGCHLEDNPNKFQQLKNSHPKLYEYCIGGGEYNEDGLWIPNNQGLGFGKVLDYVRVKY